MANYGNPIMHVLNYFETAPLPAAQQALALVRRAMAARVVDEAPAPVKRRKRRAKASTPAVSRPTQSGAPVSLRPNPAPSKRAAAAAPTAE